MNLINSQTKQLTHYTDEHHIACMNYVNGSIEVSQLPIEVQQDVQHISYLDFQKNEIEYNKFLLENLYND